MIAPRWVVTAAHVARGIRPGQDLKIGEASYAVEQVFLHPKWGGPLPEHDIALVRLQQEVVGIEPVPLYRGRDEFGQEIIVVGAGMRGTGLTGPVEDDGQIRGATNRIDEAAEAWLRFVFDAPDAENATDFEGISGPGDSGGPALLVIDGTAYLAGISSGQDDAATGGQPGRYGVSEYYTRVSSYIPWIEQTMRRAETDVVQSDLSEELDTYMTRLTAQGFSGGLLVAKDGEVVLSKGYGMADRARAFPFTNETVFPIGSITKQFTGAAILKLEMMGQLHVEDLITKYFDAVPADKAGITLHHLLTHSAGFRDALGYDFAVISRDEYIAQALGSELRFEPGTAYEYSNVGFSLLAAIVEQLSGGSYDAFVQEHLFAPAGMTRTGYLLSRWQPDDLAHGYRDDKDWGTFADKAWADDGPYWHLRGNGGILSTLGDMHRWHLALEGDAVLSEAAKEKYYASHVREGDGAPSFYGYGWSVMDSRHGRLITHNGGNPYFTSDFLRYVDADVVIYMTSNTASHNAARLSRTIIHIIFGEPYEMPPETIETLNKEDLAETPVGRLTLALLEVLATTDEDVARRFIEEYSAPRVLEKYSVEELLRNFANDQQTIGAVDVARIVKTGPHSLDVTVQSKATGAWWLLGVQSEPEPPHRLIGFSVMDTMPPAEAGTKETTAPATGPPGDKWRFPDSPTGRALTALLAAIDQGDEAHTRAFVEKHFDENFREAYSMDEHVAFFRQLHDELPDLDVAEVNKTGPNSVELILVSGQTGHKVKGSFTLEPQEPHRFNGLEFVPVEAKPDDDGGGFGNLEELDRDLKRRASKNTFSGVVLIAENQTPVFWEAYGLASKRFDVPNRPDTKFNVGSSNKMFTAVAILQLAQQGLLDLDDPIGKHLSIFPDEVAQKVTIRHLLQHRSGWGSYWGHPEYEAHWTQLRAVDDYMAFIKDLPLDFEPGTRQQYSNTGYQVLGAMVEQVSGQEYDDYVRQHVYAAAGMPNTDAYAMDEPVKNLAIGYTNHHPFATPGEGPDRGFSRNNLFQHSVRGTPAGGGYSTAEDLLHFIGALLDHRLLDPAHTTLFMNRFEEKDSRPDMWWFGGGGDGINAMVRIDLTTMETVVVLSNYDSPTARDLVPEIVEMLRGES